MTFKWIKKIWWHLRSPESRFDTAMRHARWEKVEQIVRESPEVIDKWRGYDYLNKAHISALEFSVRVGLPRLTQCFIQAGANIHACDKNGNTLLHQIVQCVGRDEDFAGNAFVQCAKVLVNTPSVHGSFKVNAENSMGYNAIGLCAKLAQKSQLMEHITALKAQHQLILTLSELGENPAVGQVGHRAVDFMNEDMRYKTLSSSESTGLSATLGAYGRIRMEVEKKMSENTKGIRISLNNKLPWL